VVEGEAASIAAVLSPIGTEALQVQTQTERRQTHLEWLGWTLIGVSAASLVGTGVSAAIVDGVNGNDLYNKYRDAVARGNKMAEASGMSDQVVNDVCKAADQGFKYDLTASDLSGVQSKCHTAATFEVLQWVFLGTAIVSGGVGAYLVMTSSSGEPPPHEPEAGTPSGPRLSLRPTFAPRAAHLSATLSF
jgi:hypothetical protein